MIQQPSEIRKNVQKSNSSLFYHPKSTPLIRKTSQGAQIHHIPRSPRGLVVEYGIHLYTRVVSTIDAPRSRMVKGSLVPRWTDTKIHDFSLVSLHVRKLRIGNDMPPWGFLGACAPNQPQHQKYVVMLRERCFSRRINGRIQPSHKQKFGLREMCFSGLASYWYSRFIDGDVEGYISTLVDEEGALPLPTNSGSREMCVSKSNGAYPWGWRSTFHFPLSVLAWDPFILPKQDHPPPRRAPYHSTEKCGAIQSAWSANGVSKATLIIDFVRRMHVSNTPKYYGPALLERENRTSLWGGVDYRSTNIGAKTPYLPHLLSITKRDERSAKFIESRQVNSLVHFKNPLSTTEMHSISSQGLPR